MGSALQTPTSLQASTHWNSDQPTAASPYPGSGLSLSPGSYVASAWCENTLIQKHGPQVLSKSWSYFSSWQFSEPRAQRLENQPLCCFLWFLKPFPKSSSTGSESKELRTQSHRAYLQTKIKCLNRSGDISADLPLTQAKTRCQLPADSHLWPPRSPGTPMPFGTEPAMCPGSQNIPLTLLSRLGMGLVLAKRMWTNVTLPHQKSFKFNIVV